MPSPTVENLKNNILTLIVSSALAAIVSIVGISLTTSLNDERNINETIKKKADKAELDKVKITVDSKAPYSYVDSEINKVKELNDAKVSGIKDLLNMIINQNKEMAKDIRELKK